jgi:hypothetical protein
MQSSAEIYVEGAILAYVMSPSRFLLSVYISIRKCSRDMPRTHLKSKKRRAEVRDTLVKAGQA